MRTGVFSMPLWSKCQRRQKMWQHRHKIGQSYERYSDSRLIFSDLDLVVERRFRTRPFYTLTNNWLLAEKMTQLPDLVRN